VNPQEFIALLAARRVYLAAEGNALKFRAPDGAVDDDMRRALGLYKESLLIALRERKGHLLLCPLSYNQHSLFFLYLLEPLSAAYNLALSLRLQSPVDAAAMRRAVERLLERHEQLRTTYDHVDLGGVPHACQFVHERLVPAFEAIDARGWADQELAERVRGFYRAPLDLMKGPMVRTGLFVRGQSDAVLVMVTHHIAADGWSMNRIYRDLSAAYGTETGGKSCGGETAGSPYTEFALEQRRLLAEPAGAGHLEYWVNAQTPPGPPLDLGREDRRPAVRRSVGATRYFRLEPLVREAVERAARELEITSFTLLLSVFQWLLFARSRQGDVVVGIPIMGHKGRRFEETVGYFVNPVPLRSRRNGSLRFREHARNTACALGEALDHREAPFAALVERLGGLRDAGRTPVFQVLFNFLSRKTLGDVVDLLYPVEDPPAVDFGGLKAGAFALDQQEGQFDLTLEFVDRGHDMLGLLKYCTDLFTATEAAALVSEYNALLESALADPNATLFAEEGRVTTSVEPNTEEAEVVVAATFTAEVCLEFFEFWFKHLGWQAHVRFAPFNQVFQELLTPASLLRANRIGYGAVLVRLEDLFRKGGVEDGDAGLAGPAAQLPAALEELRSAVETAAQAMSVPLCLVLCPSSPRYEEILRIGAGAVGRFCEALRRIPGVAVLTHDDIVRRYPVADYYEPLGEEIGHIPYTRPYLAAMATTVVRTLYALSRKPVKALVLDCDGTLWNGVVGEDGPTGVSVGFWPRRFQEFLLEQYRAGVILCLCSKNREADVWAVFDQHPDMLLRREHIAFWRINWEPKSANLRALAAEMNIGLDAVAFLDDNPMERAEVRSACPSVFCAELPEVWAERVAWLEHLWMLDHAIVTGDDRKRQEHYRSERMREELKRDAGSLRDFLAKLELRVDLRPVDVSDVERLSQLSVRTNQFNTTVLRLTPQDVAAFAGDGHSAHVALVSDRFGDYGLVGGMLARTRGEDLRVEGLFLSCRALGRGVEHRMAAYLGGIAQKAGCTNVVFPFRTTDRNEPARAFLSQLAGLCNGEAGEDAVKIAAGCLSSVHYAPPESPSEAPALRQSAESVSRDVFLDEASVVHIAETLQSVEAILAAAERQARKPGGGRGAQHAASPARPPATDTERLIADVWKRVLGLNEVSTQANFFELGGTSLLIARIAMELQRDHALSVSIMDLFHYPTIAGLARNLGRDGSDNEALNQTVAAAERQRETLGGQRMPAAYLRLKKARGK
jgi:FkbH-like protein